MPCLYAGDGQRQDTGAAETSQAGDGPSGPSLQDLINNAAAPLRIKREFMETDGENVERDGETMEVENNIVVVGQLPPAFQEIGEGEEGDPLVDVRNLFRERMDGMAAYSLPKLDNKYHTVRGVRQKSARFRELQRSVLVEDEPRARFISPVND
jgi:hypothetical protein